MADVRILQLIHVYPQFRVCEAVCTSTGQRFQNVPIVEGFNSTNTGTWMAHGVLRPASEEEAGGLQPDEAVRTVLGVALMVSGRPMIVGFLTHPMTQLAFLPDEQNRDIYRHPSGTLATVNKAGNFELHHTGACYMRIGNEVGGLDPIQHEDLTPLCANLNWLLPENEEPTVTLSNNLFRLVIEPTGRVEQLSDGSWEVIHSKFLKFVIGGDADVTVEGAATVNVEGDLSARTMGDAVVTADGDAHVLALGRGNVVSEGTLLLGSGEKIILEAPAIEIATGTLDITAGEVGVAAASVGFSAGSFGVAAASVGITAASIGLAGIVGITGLVGVVGIVDATEFITGGGFPGPPGVGGGGAATFGGTAEELALAAEEVAANEAALAEGLTDIEVAVQTTIDTSEPARGLGLPDNLGETGPPAPDVPV